MMAKRSRKHRITALQYQRLRGAVARARAAKKPPSVLPGGAGAKLHPKTIPAAKLLRGAKVEMEHGYSTRRAVEIAVDHFAEDPDYYTKLSTIEGA